MVVTDVSDMVRRDRQSSSVIMWSIGNEIDYRNDPFTHPVLGDEYRPANPPAQDLVACARPLIAAVKQLDPTRPVTAALATVAMSGRRRVRRNAGHRRLQLTRNRAMPADHGKYPQRFIYGSENGGGWPNGWPSATMITWAGIPWTGLTPGRGGPLAQSRARRRPARPGGFRKPAPGSAESLERQTDGVICAFRARGGLVGRKAGEGFGRFGGQESWNWASNDWLTFAATQRARSRAAAQCPTHRDQPAFRRREQGGAELGGFHFRAGGAGGAGRRNGQTECAFTLRTAGPATADRVLPDVQELRAMAGDVCHVEFRVVDAQGVRVPDAEPELRFTIDGRRRSSASKRRPEQLGDRQGWGA